VLLVALEGASLRPLRAPAERAEQAADVIAVINDPELVGDHVRNPWARP
jgi:hypothetical protein